MIPTENEIRLRYAQNLVYTIEQDLIVFERLDGVHFLRMNMIMNTLERYDRPVSLLNFVVYVISEHTDQPVSGRIADVIQRAIHHNGPNHPLRRYNMRASVSRLQGKTAAAA